MPNAECRMPNEDVGAHDLKRRTKAFALRILKAIDRLPRTTAGRVVGQQLCCCGTSVAAHYRAICRARSKAEFIAKIGIVEEEADESVFWIEMIVESELLPPSKVAGLLQEANELTAIVAQSRKTAKGIGRPSFGIRHSAIGISS